MGTCVCAGESGEYSDAASEGEFHQWKYDEHADDQCARQFSADQCRCGQRECIVERGDSGIVDNPDSDSHHGRTHRNRGECEPDEDGFGRSGT